MMMAERPDAQDVTSRRDAVLWMWQAHNEVCLPMLPFCPSDHCFCTAEWMQLSAVLHTSGVSMG